VLSDVAYVQTLHGPLQRLVIRAFVASFRRTFGKLRKHFMQESSADFPFFFTAVQIALASAALVVGILSKQRKITR
jgi:hypothetical protein